MKQPVRITVPTAPLSNLMRSLSAETFNAHPRVARQQQPDKQQDHRRGAQGPTGRRTHLDVESESRPKADSRIYTMNQIAQKLCTSGRRKPSGVSRSMAGASPDANQARHFCPSLPARANARWKPPSGIRAYAAVPASIAFPEDRKAALADGWDNRRPQRRVPSNLSSSGSHHFLRAEARCTVTPRPRQNL